MVDEIHLKPGTPVMYVDYMHRKFPALVYQRVYQNVYDLVVFMNTGSGTVNTAIVTSATFGGGDTGSRFELAGPIQVVP